MFSPKTLSLYLGAMALIRKAENLLKAAGQSILYYI